MGVSKVTLDGKTLIDLTGDTVSPDALATGYTAHGKDGNLIVGTAGESDYHLYGFLINQNESDPDKMITYIEENRRFTPAHMDYENDVFDYGDWGDAWFIKGIKPCMLNYDGTVAYELDPNDYEKKLDGTRSDIYNVNFPGNAMVGIPKVYWKAELESSGVYAIYVSDKKVDKDFVCWSHIDCKGNEIDYCYMPAYLGSIHEIGGAVRSLCGKSTYKGYSIWSVFFQALRNNVGMGVNDYYVEDPIWDIETYCDRVLINILLLLIGKSTNTQKTFGRGATYQYFDENGNLTGDLTTTGGTQKKGLFWGNQKGSDKVKVFGIEDYWGNGERLIGGLITNYSAQYVKMTYGKYDGSSVNGYFPDNSGSSGYIKTEVSSFSNSDPPRVISSFNISKYGFAIKDAGKTSNTGQYYCDYAVAGNEGYTNFAFVGGHNYNYGCGAFFTNFINYEDVSNPKGVISISCKPIAQTGGES